MGVWIWASVADETLKHPSLYSELVVFVWLLQRSTCRRGLATCGCLKDSISAQNAPSLLSMASRTFRKHRQEAHYIQKRKHTTITLWQNTWNITDNSSPAAGTDSVWYEPSWSPQTQRKHTVISNVMPTGTTAARLRHIHIWSAEHYIYTRIRNKTNTASLIHKWSI